MNNAQVVLDLFPAPDTRVYLNEHPNTPPTLTVSGQGLRVSFYMIDPADADYLAFARSLRAAAERLVRAYEATFHAVPGDATPPAG